MRRTNKLISLALAILMVFTLTACSESFESAMVRAVREMENVESVHADTVLDMGFTVAAMGESLDMDIGMDMSMDTAGDLTSGELSVNMLGIDVTALYIVEKRGEVLDVYLSMDGGSTWTSQLSVTSEQLTEGDLNLSYDAGALVNFYLEFATNFSDAVDESINGLDCSRYDGTFPGSQLMEAMSMSGGSSMLEGVDVETLPDAPISIWIDKSSGLPARISLDMTEAMSQYAGNLLDSSGLDGATMTVDKIGVTVDLSEYNSAEPMPVPTT